MKITLKECQDFIFNKYKSFWDRNIIEFLDHVAEETHGDDLSAYYKLLKFGKDKKTITLVLLRDKLRIFDFRVRFFAAGDSSPKPYGWNYLKQDDTLRRFTLNTLVHTFKDFSKELKEANNLMEQTPFHREYFGPDTELDVKPNELDKVDYKLNEYNPNRPILFCTESTTSSEQYLKKIENNQKKDSVPKNIKELFAKEGRNAANIKVHQPEEIQNEYVKDHELLLAVHDDTGFVKEFYIADGNTGDVRKTAPPPWAGKEERDIKRRTNMLKKIADAPHKLSDHERRLIKKCAKVLSKDFFNK